MLCLRLDPQIPEDLVDEVCAAFNIIIDQYEGMDPAVPVRWMIRVDFFNDGNDPLAMLLLTGLAALLPLVVTGATDTHQFAEFFDIVFFGQDVDYFVFFGLKGTYTCSPFSIFTV